MSLAAGTKLGRYEIRSQLGAGAMGEVYHARDPKINRDVAIKVLPAEFSSDAERLRRFEQEVQATGKLNHPNILAVYDVEAHEMSVDVTTDGAFETGTPKQLFKTDIKQGPGLPYAVSSDGSRFLINTPTEAGDSTPLVVVLNWTAKLKQVP